VEFRILGPLEAAADGRLLVLGRPKQRAVLAVLLANANQTVSLERLVDELWEDAPPAQAIASLQAYVSHLRRLLEPDRTARTAPGVLVSQPPGYRMVVAPDDLDAAHFERLAADGRRLLEGGEPDQAADVLARALAVWRGPVLADFPDAAFARGERARLEELRLVALEDRIVADLGRGRHAAVVPELERLVATHPYREGLHGLRMRALYGCGRQAEALAAYRDARRVLREELGVDPTPRLEALHQQILGHAPELDSALSAPARPEPVPPTAPERTLVGRAEQLAALERALAAAKAGSGRLVVVAGEPGVGKTRLAEELAELAEGVAVAWGRCAEEPGAPPFWPWTQVLRGLAADLPADLQAPAPPVVDVETVRFRLCRAIAELLRRLAADRPLLVVIDDLQWADVGSARVLPVLAAELTTLPILVVATYRDPDAAGGAGLADAFAALARLPAVDRVTLQGLDRVDVRRLMAARSGAEPDEGLVGVVHDRSDGNPFFVVELARLFGGGRRQAERADEVPSRVRDVLRRRLGGLPEQTRAILLVAAVVGRDFDLDVVEAVSGLDGDAALDAVEAALLSGLVVEDTAVGRFRFGHALVREAIYYEVSGLRRARMHARVAEALAGRPGGVERAAVHWWLAAPVIGTETVLPHLLAAADHASEALAHEEAEQHLGHALELLGTGPRTPERARAELEMQMRRGVLFAQLEGAQSGAGRAAMARALELAEELADGPAMMAANRALYEVAVARAEHDDARELAGRMLDVGWRLADPALLALAHLAAGRTAWCMGEPAAARDHLERSLALADAAPDPPHEALPVAVTVRLQLAPVLALLGDERAAAAEVDSAIAATRDTPTLVRAGVLTSAALISALRRDVVAAGAHAAEALTLAGPIPAYFRYASAVSSWVRALEGDPTAADALRQTVQELQSRGARHLVAWALGLLAEAEMVSGRADEAVRVLDEALELVTRTGERMNEAELHRLRGQALLVAARPADARAALEVALATATRQGAVLSARWATRDLHLQRPPGDRTEGG
jgi:DNA-binding SARP family transcriptional activator/tetratricopeptide (TPR) repeat protein